MTTEFDLAVERAREKGTPLPEIDAVYNEGVVKPEYFNPGCFNPDPKANYTPEWVLRYIHMKALSPDGVNGMYSLKPGDKFFFSETPDEIDTFVHYVVATNGYHRFWELGIALVNHEGKNMCLDEDAFYRYQAVEPNK